MTFNLNLMVRLAFSISLIFISTLSMSQEKHNLFHDEKIISDCDFTFEEIFSKSKIPASVRKNLKLIMVEYFSFDDKLHRGQILIHKDLANHIIEIFKVIKEKKFPISKVIPINKYEWSDDLSVADNNTSSFNYRYVKGTKKLSAHSLGRAIDINPKQNPHIKGEKSHSGRYTYNTNVSGTITANSFLVKEFTKRGWKWGGNWKRSKDYQHFEKLN